MAQEKKAGWLARERTPALVFAALAAAVAYFCWLLVEPLLAPIACSLALADSLDELHPEARFEFAHLQAHGRLAQL